MEYHNSHNATPPPGYSPSSTDPSPAVSTGLQQPQPQQLPQPQPQPEQQPQPQWHEPDHTAITVPTPVANHVVHVDAPAKIEPIAATPRVTRLEHLGTEPRLIDCPFCNYRAMTKVTEQASSATNIAALACCLLGGICCVCIPYLCKMCSDYYHTCTNCNKTVAIKPDSGPVQVQSPPGPTQIVSTMPAAPAKTEGERIK